MLELARIYFFLFGVLTVAGGVMGFVKAKSKPSLIAGGISGAALIAAGVLIGTGTNTKTGLFLGLIVSLALAGRFVGAFLKTKKVMPAGWMAALGIIGMIVSALALVNVS
jgi:uncharacterized membrane protein (UPF0136 family)